MKSFLPLIHSFVFVACSASQNQTTNATQNLPLCINNKIESFKKEPKQSPARSVTEYSYNGRKVYYITAPCCDQFSDVLDSTCHLLGHPDGGITGRGDGTMPRFNAEATNEKLVWKDDR